MTKEQQNRRMRVLERENGNLEASLRFNREELAAAWTTNSQLRDELARLRRPWWRRLLSRKPRTGKDNT